MSRDVFTIYREGSTGERLERIEIQFARRETINKGQGLGGKWTAETGMHVTNQTIGIPPGLFWLGNDIRKGIFFFLRCRI
jgi:hypothetical protein